VLLHDNEDPSHTGLGRRLADTDHLIPVTGQKKPTFGIIARNVQQTMALDLLLDDEIKLVTLLGRRARARRCSRSRRAWRRSSARSATTSCWSPARSCRWGATSATCPGDKDEKLGAWMQPIFDNLTYLLSTRGSPNQSPESRSPEQHINKLMADGKLVLEPLTYIRGRSIPHQFMIVDEAQNLTPHEVKTIVSRVGEGTKIVLTGDIGQIDNPYLDQSSQRAELHRREDEGPRARGARHARAERAERAGRASGPRSRASRASG
jgi:PhoH-like ATPase